MAGAHGLVREGRGVLVRAAADRRVPAPLGLPVPLDPRRAAEAFHGLGIANRLRRIQHTLHTELLCRID